MKALPGYGHNPNGWQGKTIDVDATTGRASMPRGTGRMAGLGKLAGRVAPVAFAGLDYAMGKAEGEDDIRAAAGAAGSAAGGWGGAAAGAAAGAAMGSVIPGAGTLVGGALGLAGGLIGGAAGSFAGGWGADRVDDVVRGRPQADRDDAPDTRLGMLGGAANNLSGGGSVNPWAVTKGVALGAGVLGAGAGATAVGMKVRDGYNQLTGSNEYNDRTNTAAQQFQNAGNSAIDRDVQQGIYVGERAGRFNRSLERDRMGQEYQNQYGLQGQQLASQERINTEGLRASQANAQLQAFNAAQNTAAQRAATILGTRFY